MARGSGRTKGCTRREAQARLQHAERYVEVADLVLDDGEFSGVWLPPWPCSPGLLRQMQPAVPDLASTIEGRITGARWRWHTHR